jgi:ribulose 1,5-bisphosphate synthetase/thiazole synthase
MPREPHDPPPPVTWPACPRGIPAPLPQVACVFVNAQGQRFVCEDATHAYRQRAIFQQQVMHQKPTWMIMDETQVLDTKGVIIPRLYAAGMAAGRWIGPYYPGSGTAIAGVIHWGRKAGKTVAAETPWA